MLRVMVYVESRLPATIISPPIWVIMENTIEAAQLDIVRGLWVEVNSMPPTL